MRRGADHHWYKSELHPCQSDSILTPAKTQTGICAQRPSEEERRKIQETGQRMAALTLMEEKKKIQRKKLFQGEKETFFCDECEFQARVEAVFDSHVRLHEQQYGEARCFSSCNLCHYNTQSAVQLEFHMRTCHKDQLLKQKIEAAIDEFSVPSSILADNDTDTDYSDIEFISDAEIEADEIEADDK